MMARIRGVLLIVCLLRAVCNCSRMCLDADPVHDSASGMSLITLISFVENNSEMGEGWEERKASLSDR